MGYAHHRCRTLLHASSLSNTHALHHRYSTTRWIIGHTNMGLAWLFNCFISLVLVAASSALCVGGLPRGWATDWTLEHCFDWCHSMPLVLMSVMNLVGILTIGHATIKVNWHDCVDCSPVMSSQVPQRRLAQAYPKSWHILMGAWSRGWDSTF